MANSTGTGTGGTPTPTPTPTPVVCGGGDHDDDRCGDRDADSLVQACGGFDHDGAGHCDDQRGRDDRGGCDFFSGSRGCF